MNPLTQSKKTIIRPLLVALALACLALPPASRALLPPPPPDGGYPGFNTAEGTFALYNRTTGSFNSAIGYLALFENTSGSSNTASGFTALFGNTTGENNTASGAKALQTNTEGSNNVAVGSEALFSNTIGSFNTATGVNALFSNTGSINGPSFGSFNTANGHSALFSNTTGFRNTAIGVNTLSGNLDANENTAVGADALMSNQHQGGNTAVGVRALSAQTQFGANNTAIGEDALKNNGLPPFGQAPNANTAVGVAALFNNRAGLLNTALGTDAGFNVTTARNVICIGHIGQNVNFSTWIDNIYGTATVSGTTLPVVVSDVGQLGTASSSARFKKEVKPMDRASESILAFKPVTFRYRSDKGNAPQFGLIAEEVAQVNPDLVVRDKNGEIYAVRYDAVNAMLLNEFLKEHKAALEEHCKVEKLEATLAALVATVKEQASQIQKVSAQMELSKPEPQTVLNNH